MASRGSAQLRTHDIDQLGGALEANGLELPFSRPRLAELTIFAVPLRFEQLLDSEPLDREATVALVDDVGKWADAQLQ